MVLNYVSQIVSSTMFKPNWLLNYVHLIEVNQACRLLVAYLPLSGQWGSGRGGRSQPLHSTLQVISGKSSVWRPPQEQK